MALVFGIANKKVLVRDASENKLLILLKAYNKQSLYSFVKSSLEEVPQILAGKSNNFMSF